MLRRCDFKSVFLRDLVIVKFEQDISASGTLMKSNSVLQLSAFKQKADY